MHYFTCGIHGNKELYFEIKKLLKKPSDVLWILGDILDGNTDKPWECLEILDDIEQSDNVKLVLGDHEYYHTMRILCGEDEDTEDGWEDGLCNMLVSGAPLLDYMKTKLSDEEVFQYAYFMSKCEVTELVKVGDKLLYLCHGAPSMHPKTEHGDMAWQYNVVTSDCNFKSYNIEITEDIRVDEFIRRYPGMNFSNMYVVTGHSYVEENFGNETDSIEGLANKNRCICLNQGTTADAPGEKRHKMLEIDETGSFRTVTITY